jgi:CDGSH-type Zn-finger protein
MLPLARFALELHTLGYLECRNDAPLDLHAGFPSSFARSTVVQAGLTILSSEKTFPRLFTGRIRIALEVSNGPSYNSSSMRRVLKTANKPLEIKPQEKSVWICMCGLSKNQPYCDGSHKKVADEEDGKTYEYDSEGHRREVTP